MKFSTSLKLKDVIVYRMFYYCKAEKYRWFNMVLFAMIFVFTIYVLTIMVSIILNPTLNFMYFVYVVIIIMILLGLYKQVFNFLKNPQSYESISITPKEIVLDYGEKGTASVPINEFDIKTYRGSLFFYHKEEHYLLMIPESSFSPEENSEEILNKIYQQK